MTHTVQTSQCDRSMDTASLQKPDAGLWRPDEDLEQRIVERGRSILGARRNPRTRFLSARYWSDRLMDWAMADEGFKDQMFRFIDVFPVLKSSKEVHAHLTEYLRQPGVKLPTGMGLMLGLGGLAKGPMAAVIRRQTRGMAGRFIAGFESSDALALLEKLWRSDTAATLTILGEACLSEKESAWYQQEYLRLLNDACDRAETWPEGARAEFDHLGKLPRVNLSVKISSLFPEPDSIDAPYVIDALKDRLRPIFDAAEKRNAQIHFDMEHYALKDLTLDLFEQCGEMYDGALSIVIQAYLRSAEDDAKRLIAWSQRTGRRIGVRLVKGAYWDSETAYAAHRGWPTPVWSEKHESDACFERVAKLIIDATPREPGDAGVTLALGSHNARSIAAVLAMALQADLPESAVELQMLYGMADDLKAAVAEQGLRLREYVPVGEMIPGMAYLVRRLLENTSNESWLRAGAEAGASVDALLASPHRETVTDAGPNKDFGGESPRDFADEAARATFAEAVEAGAHALNEPVGLGEDVQSAIDAAAEAEETWRRSSLDERVGVLRRLADLLRAQRDELAGLMVAEVGMGWREADAEVCAVIAQVRGSVLTADESDDAEPADTSCVALIFGDWRTPMRSLIEPMCASIMVGRPMIVAPAKEAMRVGARIGDIVSEASGGHQIAWPAAARHDTLRRLCAEDERVDWRAVSGEDEDSIEHTSLEPSAIIIDASADPVAATRMLLASAYTHQGQAPGSCKLAVIVDSCFEDCVARLVDALPSLRLGDRRDGGVRIGPMISIETANRAREAVRDAVIEPGASITTRRHSNAEIHPPPPEGCDERWMAPVVLRVEDDGAGCLRKPVDGPVLMVMAEESFDTALDMVSSRRWAMRVGVCSRTPSHIEQAQMRFNALPVRVNLPTTTME
jgi:RHH-type proline utilization regulon transcriptional repressor/proline dehydrogenase/delta 1-pyrroline-5-carboxylate dehydrogenase